MLTGENGILSNAIQAKEATRAGEVQETVTLTTTNNASADYIGGTKQTRADIIAKLHEDGNLTDEEVAILEESNNRR